LVAGPRWAPDTKTDWPTDVGRNITLTSTSTLKKKLLVNGIQRKAKCPCAELIKHLPIRTCDRVQSPSLLTSALDGGEWLASRSGLFNLVQTSGVVIG
jgi:hypothetical protein